MSAAAAATAATAAAPEAPKKKSKKLLFIIVGVVVLALAGAGGALFILKKNTADEHGDEEAAAEESHKSKTPPTFLPLENMVVNLATEAAVKVYLPSIRSQILVLISQRTAEEMLQVQGKEKLAADIIATVSKEMGYASAKAGAKAPPNPVQAVLFSSFIVQ
jgi:flagellar protein FliL